MKNVKFSRRTLLRGLGCGTVFCGGLAKNLYAQAAPRVTRVAMFSYANGSQYQSEPTGAGETFVLKPHMAPLEAVRKDIVVFKNLTMGRGSGNAHKAASFSVFGLGAPTSIDQQFATFFNGTTPLPSLEIAIGQTSGGGGVIPGLSQVNGKFIPGVKSPLAAYQRIADRITGGASGPATGTGTFLVEVIDLIHKRMIETWKADGKSATALKTAWNAYVPQHLLPRLTAFELMMVP